MFRLLRQKKGQGSMVEHTTTFFIVAVFAATMTIFVKRAIQGRIVSARNYLVGYVFNSFDADNDRQFDLIGNLYWEYEPYYADSEEMKRRSAFEIKSHLGGGPGTSGIFEKGTGSTTDMQTNKTDFPGSYSTY